MISLTSKFDLSLHKASISSKNITQGLAFAALSKMDRIFLSDSPTYIFSTSGPLIEIKLMPPSFAKALAIEVFPQPGGHVTVYRTIFPKLLLS